MNYYIQDICCFCLSIANEKCSNKSSKYPDNLTPFDKIKTVLLELSAVMCSDSRICIACSKHVDFIYEFNKTCLRNINILNSYKKVLKENKPEKQCELFVNLDEWKQFKDKLVSEATDIGSLGSPFNNIGTLCNADFVSESHSSRVAEVKEEIQINYVNCDEESERSSLGSEIKIETEETDLKQEWTSEISDPLMDASSKSTIRATTLSNSEHYISNEDSNSIISNEKRKTRRAKRKRQWNYCGEYQNKEEALNAVMAEGIWSLHYQNATMDGRKAYYRCNKIKKRAQQCDMGLYLQYNISNESVVVYKTNSNHSHDNLRESNSCFISSEMKEEIQKLFKLNVKPKKMFEILVEKGLQPRSKVQLYNYLIELRGKKHGPS